MWPHLFSFAALRYSNALPIGLCVYEWIVTYILLHDLTSQQVKVTYSPPYFIIFYSLLLYLTMVVNTH